MSEKRIISFPSGYHIPDIETTKERVDFVMSELKKYSTKYILVTGGTGYIGSHTVVELINNGYNVVIIDNLSNSSESVLDKIKDITGKKPIFHKVDIRDELILEEIFDKYKFEAVIHFAGLKAVGESVEKPLL